MPSIAQYYSHLGLLNLFSYKAENWKTSSWPFSLLPILLKITEKVDHEQTNKFSNDGNIFYKYKSGFRSKHLTDLFLSFLNVKILKGFDNGIYTGIILIDLQEGFDMINHKILLAKLLPIGFSKNTISWYESYFVKHHFTVKVANQIWKFSFRPSTIFDLWEWYQSSCRMWLTLICRWFMLALPA